MTSKILKKYSNENLEEIYESFAKDLQVKQSSSYFIFASTLEKDQQSVGNAFVACLKSVEKFYIIDATYDGYNTPIYADNCEIEIVKSLKKDGYELNEADESDLLLAIKGNKKLSELIKTFQNDVIKEWKIFINQPFAKKSSRKDHNTELLTTWIQRNDLSLEADKMSEDLSSKFKLLFL